MKIKNLLSLLLCAALLIPGCSVAASDNWFKTEKRAENTDFGAVLYSDYTDLGDKNSEHFIEKMTHAPELQD